MQRTTVPALSAALLAGLLGLTAAQGAERRLSGPEITAALADHSVNGEKDGRPTTQIFQKGGATFYVEDGNQSQGVWEVRGDQYCSQWPPSESWSCYDVVSDGTMLIFVSPGGQRYAVKPVN